MTNSIFKLLFILALVTITGCSSDDTNSVADNMPAQLSATEMSAILVTAEGKSIAELISSENTEPAGQTLFTQNCASCHGFDGASERGVPDLTNNIWSWGGSEEEIYTSIKYGREGVMAAMGRILGEVDQGQIVAYVQSLSDPENRSSMAEFGKPLFVEHCTVCHGPDGKGLIPGAPDLTDDYWQHGGSMMNIRLAINRGIEAQCPPHSEELSETELRLLTAYVINLNDK